MCRRSLGADRGIARSFRLAVALLAAAYLSGCCCAEPKVDPESGRIRLLLVGEATSGGNTFVVSLLRSDPRISHYATIYGGASAEPDAARRYVRIHFPRTAGRLASSIDVIEYMDAPPWLFTDDQQVWIHDSIRDSGMGLVLVEMGWHTCYYAWWSCNCPWDWINSPIYQAWPMDVVLEKIIQTSTYIEIVERTPVVDLPDIERTPYQGALYVGVVIARPGSKVHARWRVGKEDAIVSTTYGKGTTLSLPSGWDCIPSDMMRNWKYFIDFVLNSVYYAANVPIPEDPELAHSLRAAFTQFFEQKTLMLSLLDFIDRFGANTNPLHKMIDDLEAKNKEAGRLYMQGDYAGSWESVREALDGLAKISNESAKLRRKALFWVFVTEYLAVSGTSMACGVVLWTVMVRRRYYREVKTTRLETRLE